MGDLPAPWIGDRTRCWAEGPRENDGMSTVCLLRQGHEGPHEWQRDIAACVIRRLCLDIESRAELDHNEEAGRIFDQIAGDFYRSQRGQTEAALMEQRR